MIQSITKNLYLDFANSTKKIKGKSAMSMPRLRMISINVGINSSNSDNKILLYVLNQLSLISGQKAVLTRAKNAISSFKTRKDLPVGCRVTLRGKRMYCFLDKLVNIALPRIRDFRGLSSKGFNQSNHYTFGLKDHSVFLEVDLDNLVKVFGMNITIVTTADNKDDVLLLLKKLNFPIK